MHGVISGPDLQTLKHVHNFTHMAKGNFISSEAIGLGLGNHISSSQLKQNPRTCPH